MEEQSHYAKESLAQALLRPLPLGLDQVRTQSKELYETFIHHVLDMFLSRTIEHNRNWMHRVSQGSEVRGKSIS